MAYVIITRSGSTVNPKMYAYDIVIFIIDHVVILMIESYRYNYSICAPQLCSSPL